MKNLFLQIVVCPVCYCSLRFEGTSSHDRLIRGKLSCPSGHLYQVKDEIPILKDPKLSKEEFVWKMVFPDLQRYEEIQKQYASYISEDQRKADEALKNEMAKIVSEEKLVLDVASGMGRLLLVLSQHLRQGVSLLGTDVDETPLRGAKLKLEEQQSYNQVSLCVMDGKHLALKSQKLGCVTSFYGLDNIPETKKAFQELSRVLARKGRLVMATLWLEEGSRSLAVAEKLGYGALTTQSRLIHTLEETGFTIDSTEKFCSGKWPFNPMDRIPLEGDWFAHALVLAHKK